LSPPQLLAALEIVAGDDVAAADDDLLLAVVFEERRRGVRIGRFHHRVGWTLYLPEGLAGGAVDLEDVGRLVGLHAMKNRDVEHLLVQQRRGRVAPVQPECAVVFLDIA